MNWPMSNFLHCWPTSCLPKSDWHGWRMTPFCQKIRGTLTERDGTDCKLFKTVSNALKMLLFASIISGISNMHFQISVQWCCCIWFHNVSDRLQLKRSCLELKSRALACGIVQDSTRCAGCRAVKRTDWTCPLFRFFPFVHWLCRAVDRGEGGGGGRGGPFVWELTGELWHPSLKTAKVLRASSRLSQTAWTGKDGHISAAGQSKYDEWIHHRLVVPQFVPGGQLLDTNQALLASSVSVCLSFSRSPFLHFSSALKRHQSEAGRVVTLAPQLIWLLLLSAFPLTDVVDCWLCHRDCEP